MATTQTEAKARFIALLKNLSEFNGEVFSGKIDIFEAPTASVYLGNMVVSRETMSAPWSDCSQEIHIVISDAVGDGEDAEERLLSLGASLEAAVWADRSNFPDGVEVSLSAQKTEICSDSPLKSIITQVYEMAFIRKI